MITLLVFLNLMVAFAIWSMSLGVADSPCKAIFNSIMVATLLKYPRPSRIVA
jgi:hypothetical protein